MSGLKRTSIKFCSQWTERYRTDPKLAKAWSFRLHPWTKEIHDYDGDWVSQKAAQMGLTETALNRAFYSLDILNRDVLYILPKLQPDATVFSASRFNPALESSEHLSAMFDHVNNVGHKRAGLRNLYVRGAQSDSGLKSVPANTLVWDELNEMSRAAIALGKERLSGQTIESTQDMKLSTPTIPEYGISEEFEYSSKDHYHFRCPSCRHFMKFEFENLVITADNVRDPKLKESFLKCLRPSCNHRFLHEEMPDVLDWRKAEWVPEATQSSVRGFRINQLYSCVRPPWKIAETALKAQSNPFEEKELYRSKLGLPFVPKGARVTPEEIQECLKGFQNGRVQPQSIVTLGVDPGKWIHCEVDEWYLPHGIGPDINTSALCRNLKHFKIFSFEELDDVMRSWNVGMCVIDANPETRKAFEFSTRFPGRVFLCHYNRGLDGKQIKVDNDNHRVSVDKTSWHDVALQRFHDKRIELPMDTSDEYKEHIQALIKETYEDDSGNPRAKYIAIADDHYANARTYSEICLPLLATIGNSHQNIKDVL